MGETTNDNLYMSTSDEGRLFMEEPDHQRLTRGVRKRKQTPLKRSPSAKSVRSTKSKKSVKSQHGRGKSRRSLSRSSRGSKAASKGKKSSVFTRGKSSMTTLPSNAGNYTTLSLNPNKDSKTSTNIIIKGAFSTVKSGTSTKQSKKNLLGKKASSSTGLSKKDKQNHDLMEKLLTEITAKYKTHLCKNKDYLERLEKRTMIQEIQMLAQALISCDRA